MLKPFDAAACGVAITAVLIASLAAALFPSLRVARVNPIDTLRHD
jgi:ABC-type lipoprotein release transport system permease subunit